MPRSIEATTPAHEDAVLLTGARRLRAIQRHPFVMGTLVVFAAALLFRMGIFVGETVYLAVDGDGDGLLAATFGGGLLIGVVAVVLIGAAIDRRRRRRGGHTDVPTDAVARH